MCVFKYLLCLPGINESEIQVLSVSESWAIHVSHCPQPKIFSPGFTETDGWHSHESTKGLAIGNCPYILTLWSSRRTVLVETGDLRCTFNSAVNWAAVVTWFLDTIRVSTRTSLSDSFLLLPQLFLLDVVRPSWMYADVTLDTVALDTPQRSAALVTDAPERRAPTICPLVNSDVSPIICCVLEYFKQNCAITPLIKSSHGALTSGTVLFQDTNTAGLWAAVWGPLLCDESSKPQSLVHVGELLCCWFMTLERMRGFSYGPNR